MIEPAYPSPPRFWWLSRITAAMILTLLLLAVFHRWAEYDAEKRLAAAIATLHAAGEKIFPEEFNNRPIPDDENAADYLSRAILAINHTAESPSCGNRIFPAYLPMPLEWNIEEEKAFAFDQNALQLAHQARQHSKVDWKLQLKTPAIKSLIPKLDDERELANLLADSALYEHLTGNDYGSLETVQDLLAQAAALDRQPSLIAHLVATGIESIAISRIQLIAPGLRLADDPARPIQPIMPAQRRQVQTIIATLIDPAIRNDMRNTIEGERMLQLDSIQWLTTSSFLRQVYLRDAPEIFSLHDRMIAASTQPTFAAAMKIASPLPLKSPLSNTRLVQFLIPSYDRVLMTEYRVRVLRQMAAAALAARLYQIDHHGRWPGALDDLVPKYLPAVPIDPTSPTAQPLGYLLTKNGTRPLVHSTGLQGKDTELNPSAVPLAPQDGWSRSDRDEWMDISRFSPPPSTRSSSGPDDE